MPISAPVEEPSTVIRYSIGRNRFDAHPAQREAESFDEFEQTVLTTRAAIKGLFYVAAAFDPDHTGKPHRGREHAQPTHFLCFDFDGIPGAEAFAELCMFLSSYRGFGYTTASHTPDAPRARAILAADREMTREERMRISAYLEQCIAMKVPGIKFDGSVYRAEQPCFTPVFESQDFTWQGEPINVDAMLRFAPQVKAETTSTTANLIKIESTDPVLTTLKERGMIKRELGGGRFGVVCPCESSHSGPSESDTATVYTLPKFNGFDFGNFTCLHNHCENRPQAEFIEALGLGHKETRLEQAKVPADHSTLIENLTAKVEQKQQEEDQKRSTLSLNYVFASDIDTSDERFEDELIERVLSKDGTSVIYGDSNSGKTFLAVDMACAIAQGNRWLGRRTVQGVVLYLATEAAGSVINRLKAYKKHHRVKHLDVVVVKSPLNFYEENGDPFQVVMLIKKIEQDTGKKVELVIGDTMARIAAGANENAGQDMAVVLKHAELIKTEGLAHFLWIHHCGKDAARGMRGWSGIRAAIDTEIEVVEDKETKVRGVEITKQRDLEGKGDRYGFRLEAVKIGVSQWNVDRTSCVVVPSDAPDRNEKAKAKRSILEQMIVDMLLERNGAVKRRELVNTLIDQGKSQSGVYKALQALVQNREITEHMGLIQHISLSPGA